MITQFILVVVLAFPVPLGGSPWDKPPANWNLSDVSKILLDSPWSPTEVKLEREFTSPITDPQTRLETEAPVNANNPNQIPGIKLSRSKPQPKVPVIWWSSKTIRFAQQRLHQLSDPALAVQPLHVDDLPDYVLVIEASEALRILADAKEDLRDTVFLELASGTTLDLESAVVLEGPAQTPRIEFHFPRQIDGRATLDPESTASSSIARPPPKPRAPPTIIHSLFALNFVRAPCALTACPTFETAYLFGTYFSICSTGLISHQ